MNDHVRGEDLAAYVDGLLSAARKSELESHFSSCPACLDELVEISAVMAGREKVPARFLDQALGEINRAAPPALPLRLAFEIAAALVVVVFIGYFFLSGDRFWQAPEQQKPSRVMEEKARPQDDETAARVTEPAPPATLPRERAEADHFRADALASGKKTNTAADKDVQAVARQAMPAGKEKSGQQEPVPVMPLPAAEKESLLKQELARADAKNQVLGAGRMADAAKGRPMAQQVEMQASQARQSQPQQEQQAANAAPTAPPAKKQDAAPPRTAYAAGQAVFPVRIEGDVDWPNLQNPELVISWSWFPQDLALELQIDQAGTVIAVKVSGKVDERLAAQGKSEAMKLLFSVSEKKLRRARLVAKDAPM